MQSLSLQSKVLGLMSRVTLALLVTAALLGSAKTYAGTDYWINNTATNNLSNASSLWMTALTGGSAVTPVANDVWVFANTTAAALTNNFTSFSLGGIIFNPGTAADVIGGNAVTLKGGITNNSTALQTINFQLISQGNNTITANSGSIKIGGTLNAGTGTLTFNGAGTTTLTNNNIFNNGIVINNNGRLFSTGQFYLSGGGTVGSIFNNTGTFSNSGSTRLQGGTNTMNFTGGTSYLTGGLNIGAGSSNFVKIGSAMLNLEGTMSVGYSGSSGTGGTNVVVVNPGGVLNFKNIAGIFVGQAVYNSYNVVTNYGTITIDGVWGGNPVERAVRKQ
jgi:hypothetical protein